MTSVTGYVCTRSDGKWRVSRGGPRKPIPGSAAPGGARIPAYPRLAAGPAGSYSGADDAEGTEGRPGPDPGRDGRQEGEPRGAAPRGRRGVEIRLRRGRPAGVLARGLAEPVGPERGGVDPGPGDPQAGG